jgi:hypothetical protein
MNTIAAIVFDIDGILVHPDARIDEALRFYMKTIPDELAVLRTRKHAEESPIYWGKVFDPGLLVLDTPVPEAAEAINQLSHGRKVWFQTSRPDSMRDATRDQLIRHGFLTTYHLPEVLMMKPTDMRIYTELLKAVQVHERVWRDGIRDLIVIDDKQKNLDAILKYLPVWCNARGYLNLSDAMGKEKQLDG